ncbi:MAG: LEA type 2 family protein [Deltaproteobacteria bacterium]|nr:LEA type 2 family protein [Deltaproteobacteria bacterium]
MNRSILIITAVAILVAYLALSGCAGVGKQLDPPLISLANIRVQKVSGLETVFEIQMRVFNANDIDLNVKGISAELEINGQPFATGVSNTPVNIPSYGTELVTVTVYSSVINMFKSIYGLKDSEELNYRLKGKVRVSGNNMTPTSLPFESEGQVTLKPPKGQP